MFTEKAIREKTIELIFKTQVCVVLFIASTLVAGDNVPIWQKEVISTLDYIAHGYETYSANANHLLIRGRIFHTQRAQEGRSIPENNIFSPKWVNFEHVWKNGKRRYEQESLTMPGQKFYVLDNNERLLSFATNTVRVWPLTKEESNWVNLTDIYGDFFRLSGIKGFGNVGMAMRTLIEKVKQGVYDQTEQGRIQVTAVEDGLFTIYIKRGIDVREFTIDSHKGFNLVKLKYRSPFEKNWLEEDRRCEYTQLANGYYALTNAEITGLADGVVYEQRLETTKTLTDYEVPDEYFEKESLNIPADIHWVDYSFSPPIELNKGGPPPVIDNIEELIESDITKTEVAKVDNKGEITKKPHQAYVEHEARNSKKSVEAPIAASEGKWSWFVIVFALIVTIGGTVSFLIYRCLKGQVQQ